MHSHSSHSAHRPTIAIIGAGAAGLMAADYLCQFPVNIEIYEQMPTAGRKILMAGKTGLNISHAEPLSDFVQRYTPNDWLTPFIEKYPATWIQSWLTSLGITTYVGSSGRIFPVEMKAAPFLRAWLNHLKQHQVQFFYRHRCVEIQQQQITFQMTESQSAHTFTKSFDAIILACGGVSWSRLGSDGQWQRWLNAEQLTPFYASNVGIEYQWSSYMQPLFGQPLKRVKAWVSSPDHAHQGDIIITHYGLESGLIYRLNRELYAKPPSCRIVHLDLLPDISLEQLQHLLTQNKKQSLQNRWRKCGLDPAKIALLRECVPKKDWADTSHMAQQIKHLRLTMIQFRPIEEAISSAGGIKRTALTSDLQLKSNPSIFCCGEMLDWDAPTGGYLLTACFATGRVAGEGVIRHLKLHLGY